MTNAPFSATIEDITPDVAKAYLTANRKNRKMSQKALDALSQDMLAGNWKLTGEAIKFDTNNNLIDGQHRLTAIERTGVTVPLLVIRNVEPETQLVLDTGMKRTGAHALDIIGSGRETVLKSAMANMGITDDAGKFTMSNSPLISATHSQIVDWVSKQDQKLLDDAIHYGSRVHRVLRGSKSSICYAYLKIAKVSPTSAANFFDDIADLSTSGAGDPRNTLINKLNKSRDSFRGTGYRAKYVYHFLRAWEAYYLGQELRLIRDNIGGKAIPMPDLSRYLPEKHDEGN